MDRPERSVQMTNTRQKYTISQQLKRDSTVHLSLTQIGRQASETLEEVSGTGNSGCAPH